MNMAQYLEAEKKKAARAKKNAVPMDDDLETIIICAARYALGRKTYMPGLVTDLIKRVCAGKLSHSALTFMLRDIDDERLIGIRGGYNALGDDCDVRMWERFEDWLKREDAKFGTDNP